MTYFMDTCYFLALYDKKDKYPEKALELKNTFKNIDRFILTDAILLEIGNGLSNPKFRKDASFFIREIRKNANFRIFPISQELLKNGLKLFSAHQDKYWGLIDCISFSVMKDRKFQSL